jgi:hypothetical protein
LIFGLDFTSDGNKIIKTRAVSKYKIAISVQQPKYAVTGPIKIEYAHKNINDIKNGLRVNRQLSIELLLLI